MTPRILIADDSPGVCRALRRVLRRLGTVEVADGGSSTYAVCLDATKRALSDPPGAVVLDGLEGEGRWIAERLAREGIPVVAFTSKPALFDGLKLPVIVKPHTDELVAAVAAALGVARAG